MVLNVSVMMMMASNLSYLYLLWSWNKDFWERVRKWI